MSEEIAAPPSRERMPFGDLVRFIAALLLVAVGAAAFAVLFREALTFAVKALFGGDNLFDAFRDLPTAMKLLVPLAGGALAGFCASIATRAKAGSGVGEVMETIVLGQGRISLRATSWKALGCWFAIASGGSIGREGPLIQFGGGLGGALSRLFRLNDPATRALIAAGTAAGFAAAYNTPFAAILFVTEVVTGVVALDVLLPAIVAVPIATMITRALAGAGPIYGQRAFALISPWEIGVYALLGALAGVLAVGFMALLASSEDGFARLQWPRPIRAALGGLAVGAMAIAVPEITGNGYETINLILDGRFAVGALLLLIVSKASATSLSVGSGAPGGVFTPTLMLGAALGCGLGSVLAQISPHFTASPGAYALVGMAAVCAATTHAPLMSAVLVFELSGDYAIVLPLMIAVATSTIVARNLRPDSLYGAELRRRGIVWEVTVAGRRIVGLGEPKS